MKVLVIDDHAIVRQGVKQVLADEFADLTVHEAATGRDGLAKAAEEPLDAIVLDLNLPDMRGLDVLEKLRGIHPGVPVVVLTFHPETQYAVQVLRAGGSAYVTKESAPSELVTALRKVIAGGRYVSPQLAEVLADALSGVNQRGKVAISSREHEVLVLLGRGRTVTAIAKELGLSDKTVSTYRARLLEKLGLETTADLIRYAVENRLAG